MHYIVQDLLTLHEKEIASADYKLVMSHLEILKKLSCEIDYYMLVELSIKDFLLLQDKIQSESYNKFVFLNSKFANLLNAFYMWLEYHKKEYNYETEDLITTCTKDNIYFNLTRELRNHVVHDGFAISIISFDCLKEEILYLIKPGDILRQKTNSQLKKWLSEKIAKNEEIDSINCIKQFSEVFNELQFKIWNKLLPESTKRINDCIKTLKLDGADIRNIVIDCGDSSYMAGHILGEIRDKMLIADSLARID